MAGRLVYATLTDLIIQVKEGSHMDHQLLMFPSNCNYSQIHKYNLHSLLKNVASEMIGAPHRTV